MISIVLCSCSAFCSVICTHISRLPRGGAAWRLPFRTDLPRTCAVSALSVQSLKEEVRD